MASPVQNSSQPPAEQHTAGTQSPGGGQEAFPPFDPRTFTPTIFWLIITFGLLYLILSRYALPRIEGILKSRSARIHADLSAAHKMRDEANEAAAAYERTLSQARSRSQELASETRAKVKLEQETKRQAIEADLSSKLLAAEERISNMKSAAMENVGQIATEAASAIVQHITGKPADRDAVEKAIAEVRVV